MTQKVLLFSVFFLSPLAAFAQGFNASPATGNIFCPTCGPIAGKLAIATNSLPNAIDSTSYSATLNATGGTPPYAWSIFSGTLPSGLSLSSSGVISGTTTVAPSTFNIVWKVTDTGLRTAKTLIPLTVSASPPASTVLPPQQWASSAVAFDTQNGTANCGNSAGCVDVCQSNGSGGETCSYHSPTIVTVCGSGCTYTDPNSAMLAWAQAGEQWLVVKNSTGYNVCSGTPANPTQNATVSATMSGATATFAFSSVPAWVTTGTMLLGSSFLGASKTAWDTVWTVTGISGASVTATSPNVSGLSSSSSGTLSTMVSPVLFGVSYACNLQNDGNKNFATLNELTKVLWIGAVTTSTISGVTTVTVSAGQCGPGVTCTSGNFPAGIGNVNATGVNAGSTPNVWITCPPSSVTTSNTNCVTANGQPANAALYSASSGAGGGSSFTLTSAIAADCTTPCLAAIMPQAYIVFTSNNQITNLRATACSGGTGWNSTAVREYQRNVNCNTDSYPEQSAVDASHFFNWSSGNTSTGGVIASCDPTGGNNPTAWNCLCAGGATSCQVGSNPLAVCTPPFAGSPLNYQYQALAEPGLAYYNPLPGHLQGQSCAAVTGSALPGFYRDPSLSSSSVPCFLGQT